MSLPAPPDPPADLARRSLPLSVSKGPWFRTHGKKRSPMFFGRKASFRFDAPKGEFGVLYVGGDEACAFIETFGRETGVRLVEMKELGARSLSRIMARRPLSLVRLHAEGLASLGADARLATGDYAIAQRWSLAIHSHPEKPDGIEYISRHDTSKIAIAIFDRAKKSLRTTGLGSWSEAKNAVMLGKILDTYEFGIA